MAARRPGRDWGKPVGKARYLLAPFSATPEGQDPPRRMLVPAVHDDSQRLLQGGPAGGNGRG